MKNPFQKKEDHTLLIAGFMLGTVAAATAYLALTKTGAGWRKKIVRQVNNIAKSFTQNDAVQVGNDHATDYLQKKKKAPKTDRNQLKHQPIIPEQAS